MSDYGLEIRDPEGNIIMDSSTFTVRQVAKRFISSSDLKVKVGKSSWTKAVVFPWAESKYGMFISVTQLGLRDFPSNPTPSQVANATESGGGSISMAAPNSLDRWILDSPRLPVARAYDGYITLAPAVYEFNAHVWVSLYVVV